MRRGWKAAPKYTPGAGRPPTVPLSTRKVRLSRCPASKTVRHTSSGSPTPMSTRLPAGRAPPRPPPPAVPPRHRWAAAGCHPRQTAHQPGARQRLADGDVVAVGGHGARRPAAEERPGLLRVRRVDDRVDDALGKEDPVEPFLHQEADVGDDPAAVALGRGGDLPRLPGHGAALHVEVAVPICCRRVEQATSTRGTWSAAFAPRRSPAAAPPQSRASHVQPAGR